MTGVEVPDTRLNRKYKLSPHRVEADVVMKDHKEQSKVNDLAQKK